MSQLAVSMIKKKDEHPSHPINAMVSGICVCFAVHIGASLPYSDKITAGLLSDTAKHHIRKNGLPKQLTTAFDYLCAYILDDELIRGFYRMVESEGKYSDLPETMEFIIQNELSDPLYFGIETPQQIIALCINLAQPINGLLYDGTSGLGSVIIAAHRCAKKNCGNLSIYTQEVNPLLHALSVMRAYVHGLSVDSMYCADTLINPMVGQNNLEPQKFDVSVMLPPAGMSWKDFAWEIRNNLYHNFPFGLPPTSSADWLFAQHQYNVLTEGGVGVIVFPAGALFNAATGHIRKSVINAGIIECIIALPSGMLRITNVPICIMVIRKTRDAYSQVFMVQAEALFPNSQHSRKKGAAMLDEDISRRICELFKSRRETEGVSRFVSAEELAANDWVLLPSRYVLSETVETEYGKLAINYPNKSNWIPLRETGEFYRGLNIAPSATPCPDGEYSVVNISDVQNGQVMPEQLTRYNFATRVNVNKYAIRPSDLLVSCKGPIVKTCVVPSHDATALLSIGFIGIRVNKEKFNPLFIKYYLESPAGQAFLKNKQVGTSIITLAMRDLEEILLPNLTLEEQNKYVSELFEAEREIQVNIEKLNAALKESKWSFYQKIGLGEVMKPEV
ncbi:MAG: N-6 DNA methylase [Defluviitaleaceae bacterium]|nr:N-6 DNA methylase [Defluviitaleaceae bacterium]